MYRLGLFKLFERMKSYEHLQYTLEIKKCLTYVTLTEVLKTEYNLKHFNRNCKIKNLDDFERDEAEAYLWRARLLNVKEKGMTICYI